jgi:hypothetical protein
MTPSALAILVAEGRYEPKIESEAMLSRFNQQALKREQAERAMGCYGMAPIYTSVSMATEGDRSYGKCSIILQDIEDRAVLVCGDSFRLRNPARDDYVADPALVLYPFSAMDECKTASVILNMRKRDLLAGPAVALASVIQRTTEFGKCEALIFGTVAADQISEIVANSEEMSRSIRKILIQCGKLIPVVCSEKNPFLLDVAERIDSEQDNPPITDVKQKHFEVGDRVSSKRMASQPQALGTIIDIKGCNVTVEWEGGQRGIFDMNEALMRLLPAQKQTKEKLGMVVYSLPGMENDTVVALSEAGIDPVSLYALVSHHYNYGPTPQQGELERLVSSLAGVGVSGHVVKGFVPYDGPKAFEKREWVEAPLPSGARLIVDLTDDIKILSGDPPDYIPADDSADIEIE